MFESDQYFPRATASESWRHLVHIHGTSIDELVDRPIDVKRALFHPGGERRAEEAELLVWRSAINEWAWDNGFPAPMNSERRSRWDVELGQRLLADVESIPEILHPNVWAWIATFLLPHLVVHRWDWPKLKDGTPPAGKEPWRRFGADPRNALLLAVQRIRIYGADIALTATEQEFQSLQYRPAYGADPRVARTIMETLVSQYEDLSSNYGKNGGTRALDCNEVCIELRLINSLRPLCFMDDERIRTTVAEVIERLPGLRRSEEVGSADVPAE